MKKIYPIFLLITVLLSGCTVESNRIYNVCKVSSDGTVFCYNDAGEFFKVYNDTVLPISGVGLYPYPTLKVIPTEGPFDFTYVLPGNYTGSLRDVNHYVFKLLKEDNAAIVMLETDCHIIDFKVISDLHTTRIIYNKSGTVRIYCVDNSGNPLEPLYINK